MVREATTGEVARELHVSPRTIRNWATEGRIPFDETEGGHRRFDLKEVRAAIVETQPRNERRSVGPTVGRPASNLASADDLVAWADQIDARARFPELIQRLLLASDVALVQVEVRTGAGVDEPHWDAQVDAAEGTHPFIPRGVSMWELGTGRDPKRKATRDFAKRMAESSSGFTPEEATFVFATPRRFSGKLEWARSARQSSSWRDVRVIDADDLAGWLTTVPAVHLWVSAELGRDPAGASDLGSFWTEWHGATNPPITGELLLAGRGDDAARLRETVTGPPASVGVRASSQDEAIAFVCAVLAEHDDSQLLERAVLVDSAAAWRQLAASPSPLVLVPRFAEAAVVTAVEAGHHVVIPLGREAPEAPRDDVLTLRELDRDAADAALERMGVEEPERRNMLAGIARRSLLSLRRQLAAHAGLKHPWWADPAPARALLPAVLAGTWNADVEDDRDALATLADTSYDSFERELTALMGRSDPPIRRTGNQWFIAAKIDAFEQTRRFADRSLLERYIDVCLDVLGVRDPGLTLPPEERWMAGLHGLRRPHSPQLAAGLADTLALMATVPWPDAPLDGNGQQLADRTVRQLLEAAAGEDPEKGWPSLAPYLPSLAEAAPEVFLSTFESDLAHENPTVAALFTGGSNANLLGPTSPHPHLLWALERLAWSPELLGRVAPILARLDALNPDDRGGNAPLSSLRDILLPWLPHTSASLAQRLDVLDVLRERCPEVAWRLQMLLLRGMRGVVSPTSLPRWRDWPAVPRRLLHAEIDATVREIGNRLLEDVGDDSGRWADLVDVLPSLPAESRQAIRERIDSLEVDPDASFGVAAKLRELVGRHRRFQHSTWALPPEEIEALATTLGRLTTEGMPAGEAWLFSHHPSFDLPDPLDHEAYRSALSKRRQSALERVFGSHGLEGLFQVAALAEHPWTVGETLATSAVITDDVEIRVLELLGSSDGAARALAHGYVTAAAKRAPDAWIDDLLIQREADPLWQAAFLAVLPDFHAAWPRADAIGGEVAERFWQQASARRIVADEAFAIVDRLVDVGRASVAVEVLADSIGFELSPPSDLVVRALRSVDDAPEDVSMFAYRVGELLDWLGEERIEEELLAELEWFYVPLIDMEGRSPKTLHRRMASDHAFFAELVRLAYISDEEDDDEAQREPDEKKMRRARQAHDLLRSCKTVPGSAADGDVNSRTLRAWVAQVRETLDESGHRTSGDLQIGRLLRHATPDEDGLWPPLAVRDLIEELRSEPLERGLEIEIYNSRGVTMRTLTAGGQQERVEAAKHRAWASSLAGRWPRTSELLGRVARSFEDDARREDLEAELRQDRP